MYSAACNMLYVSLQYLITKTSTFIYVLIFEIPKSSEQYCT